MLILQLRLSGQTLQLCMSSPKCNLLVYHNHMHCSLLVISNLCPLNIWCMYRKVRVIHLPYTPKGMMGQLSELWEEGVAFLLREAISILIFKNQSGVVVLFISLQYVAELYSNWDWGSEPFPPYSSHQIDNMYTWQLPIIDGEYDFWKTVSKCLR